VYNCSQHSLFRLTTTDTQPKCEYQFDPTVRIELTPQNAIPIPLPQVGSGTAPPVPTLASLQTSDPTRYGQYKAELDRVNAAIQGILSGMDRDRRLRDAFTALQTAELNRATDPIGYQKARNEYYTLAKGDQWLQGEEKRIVSDEVSPEIQRYRSLYETALEQKTGQQKTLDIIEAVKDRVLSLKDDFQWSTSMFKTQLDRVKSQLNMERRGREATTVNEDTTGFYQWFTILLNLAIVVAGIYLALTLWKVVRKRWTAPEQGVYTVQVAKP
jgi:hypothetical protein